MAIFFMTGLFFTLSGTASDFHDSSIFQGFILGFIGISAAIIPGIDGVSILSALGLYSRWLNLTSLNSFNLAIYLSAGIGIIAGGIIILSKFINFMIKRYYTGAFSILFGFFLIYNLKYI